MNREQQDGTGKRQGIRLNHLNIVMICIGLVLATLLVVSMFRTTDTVKQVVSFTNNYLVGQQTGGMLRDFAGNLSEQAVAFVQSGEIGPAKAYEAQLKVINEQLELHSAETAISAAAATEFDMALEAFRGRLQTERIAMRMAAESMPEPMFEALPDFLKETELSEEDKALSEEARKGKAISLLTSESYTGLKETIRNAVDKSHRFSSQEGQMQAGKTFDKVQHIMGSQTVLVILFLVVSVLALLLNRFLIISPIQKSVENLDKREPIPEKGSYEMRHLARVYNDVLKDNEEKTEKLSYTATHDALTGVYNRTEFDRYYRQVEKLQNVGIIVVDVDHFKQYNDEYGHDIGDRVLCAAVEAMKRNFRTVDHISRIGGDEFCVIMPGIGQEQAGAVTDIIRKINHELQETGTGLPPITISAGFAFWNRPNPGESLFRDADDTLLSVKKTRTDCCAVYPG